MRVKKDVLAAITFLATGLLFFVAEAGEASDGLFSTGVDCEVAETVVAKDNAPKVPEDLELSHPAIRDS